jgi:hypothetical protein
VNALRETECSLRKTKSGLTRLSDTVKLSLDSCAATTRQYLDLWERYREPNQKMRVLALKIMEARSDIPYMDELRELAHELPGSVLLEFKRLTAVIHTQALSAILLVCFTSESYANSFAHYLGNRSVVIPQEGNSRPFEWLPPIAKWLRLASLGQAPALDPGRSPLQDLQTLFRFRDDHVHDRPVELSSDRRSTYGGGKLPDPIGGLLDLGHANFAASAYWAVVARLHEALDMPQEEFQRQYNVSPWLSARHRDSLESLASAYREAIFGE